MSRLALATALSFLLVTSVACRRDREVAPQQISASFSAQQTLSDLPLSDCYEVELTADMKWPTSGAWSSSASSTILVVDTLRNVVFRFSRSGNLLNKYGDDINPLDSARERGDSRGSYVPQSPLQLHSGSSGGQLLLDGPLRIAQLDDDFRLQKMIPVAESIPPLENAGGDGRVLGIYDFSDLDDGVLALADVARASEGELMVVFLENAGTARALCRLTSGDGLYQHYVVGIPRITSIGSVGYFIAISERQRIVEVKAGDGICRPLDYFPEGFQGLPEVDGKGLRGFAKVVPYFESLSVSRTAVGLYSWRGYLYLLLKDPSESNGVTFWWLSKLDPRDGRELSRIQLPVSAPALTAIPGDTWFFIEKWIKKNLQTERPYMEVGSAIFVPARWLERRDTNKGGDGCVRVSNLDSEPGF